MRKADAKEQSQPLAEVFGHLVNDQTSKADRYRSLRLCPFNNKVPNCTKDKAKNPLGVCSIFYRIAQEMERLTLDDKFGMDRKQQEDLFVEITTRILNVPARAIFELMD